jgi:hypothetical protein
MPNTLPGMDKRAGGLNCQVRVGVVYIDGPGEGDENKKYVLDKAYFDDLLKRYSSLLETIEITVDRKLFNQIMAVADSLDEDLRQGKLHSFEEAFGEE